MSERTQLTRITVPAITDTRYIEGMADAFDKINDNFKKIASLPFLQGVQGDSYQLEEYKIWNDNWTITDDGKVLLDSIFGIDVTIDVNGNIKNAFTDIRKNIGQELDGVSPLDFFVAEDENTIINNALYFYVIKDDTGNVIEKQLGQYYYFVDGRLKKIGNVYNGDILDVSLDGFNDYTGFYQYKYNPKSYNQSYLKVEILPSIYYDQNKNDICWKFNGNETGISAIGVKGADGKDADLLIVKVTANENDCTGVVVAMINPISGNTAEYKWIDDPTDFKAGKALICIQNEKEDAQDFAYGQVIQAGDDFNAYWEPNYNFSKLIGNNRITNYFYNMGDDDTETSPFYLAIPSSYNRGASGTAENKMKAHVIKGSSETSEDLNIFYSEDAFGENGEQNSDVTSSSSTKNLNIQNYNTQISKKLTVSGSAEVSGGLSIQNGGLSVKAGDLLVADNATISKKLTVSGSEEVSGGLTVNSGKFIASSSAEVSGGLSVKNGGAVISSGGIQVTTEKPAAAPKTGKDANVNSNVLKGYNDPGDGAYNYFPNDITKGGYPLVTMSYDGNGAESKDCMVFGNGDICALTWNGTKYEPGTLCLQDIYKYSGKTKVGGSFEVGGTASLNNTTNIGGVTKITNVTDSTGTTYGALVVSGGAGIAKSLYIGGTTNIGGTTKITNTAVSSGTGSGALVVTGGVGIGGAANIGGTTKITNTAVSSSVGSGALVVSGGAGIGGALNIGGTTKIINTAVSSGTGSGALVVTGGVGIGGAANIGGTTKITNTAVSSGTGSGALVVSGGAGIGGALNIGGKITGNSGIKIIGGDASGIDMYSGTGSTKDNNHLKIDKNGVFVNGNVGRLVLNGAGASRQLLIGSLATNNAFNAGIDINNTDDNTSTMLFKGKNANDTNYSNQMVITTNVSTSDKYSVGRLYMGNNYDKQYIQIFAGYGGTNPIYGYSKSGIQIYQNTANDSLNCVTIKPKIVVDGTASSSDSTSTTTGALVVKGGVGITGAVNIGSTSDSTSTTTGGLTVAGGVGIKKQVQLGQYLSINSTYLSNKETSDKISDITDDVHPGQIYLGEPPSNKTTPINRMLINRHSIQAYTTYGTSGAYKSPDPSTLYINHKGGNVIVGKNGYKLDVKGNLEVQNSATFNTGVTVNGDLTVNKIIKNNSAQYTYGTGSYGISCWSGTNKWSSNKIDVTFECNQSSNENRTFWLSNYLGSCVETRVWYNVIVKFKNTSTKDKSQTLKVGIKYKEGARENSEYSKTTVISSHTVPPHAGNEDNYSWAMFTCMLLSWNSLLVIPVTTNSVNVHK